MLTPWLQVPGVEQTLGEFSDVAKIDLVAHGTTSDADTIRDTAVAQPLIVASSLLAYRAIFDQDSAGFTVSVTAGHSVGEFAAAAVAGVLEDSSAVALVSHRARFMAQAAAAEATGMAAVVGGDPTEVLAAIETAGLTPANVNSAAQVVAAGSLSGLEAFAATPPAKARVLPLKVAGAFHTSYMASAHDQFNAVATTWESSDPSVRLLSNRDGQAFTGGSHGFGTGSEVLAALTSQIVSPVRWDLCQETLASLGVTGIIELAPGGVLTGIAKRSLPGVELLAIKSVDDLDTARAFVAQHAH